MRALYFRLVALSALVLLSVGLWGCVTRVADLTLVSNRNIEGLPVPVKSGVVGRHCQIIWSMGMQPSLEEAIDRAQKQVPEATALTNVAVYVEVYNYVLIQQACFKVEGDAAVLSPSR